MGEVVAEQRLAGGAHAQALFQLVQAAVGDPGHLGGKALHVVLLLLEQALGDEDGHGHVLMAGGLEHAVQDVGDVLPDGVAVGAQDHAALHAGIVHQLRLEAHVGVPLGKILVDGGDGLHQFLLLFAHLRRSFLFGLVKNTPPHLLQGRDHSDCCFSCSPRRSARRPQRCGNSRSARRALPRRTRPPES